MSVVSTLTAAGTIVSGIVSLGVILGLIADRLTGGWIKHKARRWLGIEGLRHDHHITQTFLNDLGDAHNELVEVVCNGNAIEEDDRPNDVDTDDYRRLMDDGAVERGYFLREND